MKTNRPTTTLFMLSSLDGKISTGDSDEMDVDKDFPKIRGVCEGLQQYYDIEKTTDNFSLNSGRVMAKIGLNERKTTPTKIGCSFVIIDSKPHLTDKGVEYLSKWVKKLYLVTTNKNHPAFKLQKEYDNIEILFYNKKIDLKNLLETMKKKFGCRRITIQSGGTLNVEWLRKGLIDRISLVIAPCLIGGINTQSLIGGESLHIVQELSKIKALQLQKCTVLKHSYLHLLYKVINEK